MLARTESWETAQNITDWQLQQKIQVAAFKTSIFQLCHKDDARACECTSTLCNPSSEAASLNHSCTRAATRWHAFMDVLKVPLWSTHIVPVLCFRSSTLKLQTSMTERTCHAASTVYMHSGTLSVCVSFSLSVGALQHDVSVVKGWSQTQLDQKTAKKHTLLRSTYRYCSVEIVCFSFIGLQVLKQLGLPRQAVCSLWSEHVSSLWHFYEVNRAVFQPKGIQWYKLWSGLF